MSDFERYVRFRSSIAQALDERLYPLAYVDALVASGLAQMICSGDSIILFKRKGYPSGMCDVHGLVAAGDMGRIANELIPLAEQWGRQQGCTGASIASRPGWARTLKSQGYEPHQLTLRKAL